MKFILSNDKTKRKSDVCFSLNGYLYSIQFHNRHGRIIKSIYKHLFDFKDVFYLMECCCSDEELYAIFQIKIKNLIDGKEYRYMRNFGEWDFMDSLPNAYSSIIFSQNEHKEWIKVKENGVWI